jgi:hypothetical protein
MQLSTFQSLIGSLSIAALGRRERGAAQRKPAKVVGSNPTWSTFSMYKYGIELRLF